MKTSTRTGSFIAAAGLAVAILVGSTLPSQAQTSARPQAQFQSAGAMGSGWHGGNHGAHGPMGGGCGW